MPGAPRSATQVAALCKSAHLKFANIAYRQEDFEFFVKGEKHVLNVKHSAKDMTLEATVGKAFESVTNVSFGDTSAFPIVLNEENIGVKIVLDFDQGVDEYLVDVNGEPMECLPYLDSSFCLEDNSV